MIDFAMTAAGYVGALLVGVVLGRYIADRSNENEISVLRGKLARIAAIEGCECDSYTGHRCMLCRVRALAYDELRV